MDGARLLEEKCREFSVEGTVVQIHPGPVVTTYEFKPDAGVKYSKITGLADDLCLAMQAESVIIDRIPGKSTVGIQIPEPEPRADLAARAARVRRLQALPLQADAGDGQDHPRRAVPVSDLATMPHLLIAGSTGAGKSVSVNAMITSILMRATPDDVRFIMVDPKRLELGMYEDIPHLLTPVVMDPKLAANALRWAVREMEERYKTLAAFGVRNIEQYNRNVRAMQAEKKGEPLLDDKGNELKTLPFIVVLIDELADLMMVAGNEVEESIARLAQMARAIGIHLVLATQRPSVDVITGLIKANMPARVSFRVTSKIDSRTILDGNGAEQLLGKGDMLYLPPASSRFVRLHGPYISEQESARLASFLRKQGKPTYDTTVTADDKGNAQEHAEFDKDELYDEASRIVVSSGQASISYLQRRLRIGFSRAARLVDMMEMDGLVSARGGRQAARGARQEGILRRSGCAASIGGSYETPNTCGARHGRVPRRPAPSATAPTPARDMYNRAMAHGARGARRREQADGGADAPGRGVLRERRPRSTRPAATATTRSGRPRNLAALAFERFGNDADRKTAARLFTLLAKEYPTSKLSRARTRRSTASTPRAAPPRRARARACRAAPAGARRRPLRRSGSVRAEAGDRAGRRRRRPRTGWRC